MNNQQNKSFYFSSINHIIIITASLFTLFSIFLLSDTNTKLSNLPHRELLTIPSKTQLSTQTNDYNNIPVEQTKTNSPTENLDLLLPRNNTNLDKYISTIIFKFQDKTIKLQPKIFNDCIYLKNNQDKEEIYPSTNSLQVDSHKTGPKNTTNINESKVYLNTKQQDLKIDEQHKLSFICFISTINSIPQLAPELTTMSNKKTSIKLTTQDFSIEYDKFYQEFVNKLINYLTEFKENNVTDKLITLKVPINKNAPNTDGSLAPIYVETDGSRQLVFLWQNGKYEVFKMSGAYPKYNPVGIYQFYYKSEKAWSKYANVWMPYWMAFTTDPKTGARIGLHGLIYYCPNREGMYCDEYIYEPESNLGTPKSMGCLRVSIENAKYIYNKIKIGDYIVVHD